MRPILKRLEVGPTERREIVRDEWKYLGEEGANADGNVGPTGAAGASAGSALTGGAAAGAGSALAGGNGVGAGSAMTWGAAALADVALIVPFAEFRANIDRWRQHPGRLGVQLSPADAVEELGDDVQRLSLVAVTFPSAGEGRGYTQGRLLRSARFGFKGELRAVGAGVKQDLLFIMARCGFDAFELAPGQSMEEALRAFHRYSVAYAPAEPLSSIEQQRFYAAG